MFIINNQVVCPELKEEMVCVGPPGHKMKAYFSGWREGRHQSTNPMKRGPCFCLRTMVFHCLSRTIADIMYLKIHCEMAQWAKVLVAKADGLSWIFVNSQREN